MSREPFDDAPLWLWFPGLPTSTNRMKRIFRGASIPSQEYKDFKNLIAAVIATHHKRNADGFVMPWDECGVATWLFPATRRRYDADNRNKSLHDALTEARFWPDDQCVQEIFTRKCFPVRGGATVVCVYRFDPVAPPPKAIPAGIRAELPLPVPPSKKRNTKTKQG